MLVDALYMLLRNNFRHVFAKTLGYLLSIWKCKYVNKRTISYMLLFALYTIIHKICTEFVQFKLKFLLLNVINHSSLRLS